MDETLLSTCASAGATLVAIIGGLLISRHISIDTEMRAARRQHSDLEQRKSDVRTQLTDANKDLDRFSISWSLDDSDAYEIVRNWATSTKAVDIEILKHADPDFHEFEDVTLREVVEDWVREANTAAKHPEMRLVERDDWWHEFRRERDLPIKIDAVWDQEFEFRRRSAPPTNYLGIEMSRIASTSNWRKDEQNHLRRVRDDLEQEHLLLNAQARLARENVPTQPPRGLWAGLWVLGLLTLATVVLPILYLTPSSSRGPMPAWAIVAVFFAGVGVLFGYMIREVVLIRELALQPTLSASQTSPAAPTGSVGVGPESKIDSLTPASGGARRQPDSPPRG